MATIIKAEKVGTDYCFEIDLGGGIIEMEVEVIDTPEELDEEGKVLVEKKSHMETVIQRNKEFLINKCWGAPTNNFDENGNVAYPTEQSYIDHILVQLQEEFGSNKPEPIPLNIPENLVLNGKSI